MRGRLPWIFTQGLTKALKSVTDETTYFGLLEALPSTVSQTPVIAGNTEMQTFGIRYDNACHYVYIN